MKPTSRQSVCTSFRVNFFSSVTILTSVCWEQYSCSVPYYFLFLCRLQVIYLQHVSQSLIIKMKIYHHVSGSWSPILKERWVQILALCCWNKRSCKLMGWTWAWHPPGSHLPMDQEVNGHHFDHPVMYLLGLSLLLNVSVKVRRTWIPLTWLLQMECLGLSCRWW